MNIHKLRLPKEPSPMSSQLQLNDLVGFKVRQLAVRIANTMARSYSRTHGIGIPSFRIILRLGILGSASLVGLADASGMDPAVVSRTVEKLEAQGLLNRGWHPEDKRRRVLSLSEAGKKLHAQLLPIAYEFQDELVEGFNEKETTELNRILDLLLVRIDEIQTRQIEEDQNAA
jgi:DNA-binding MarR family transcriptional regulator